jgi:hypothetical protein
MTRKYIYTKDFGITTIPINSYHNSVPKAIGGGRVTKTADSLIFWGRSDYFGNPDLFLLKKIIATEVEDPFYLMTLLEGVSKVYISANTDINGILETLDTIHPDFVL